MEVVVRMVVMPKPAAGSQPIPSGRASLYELVSRLGRQHRAHDAHNRTQLSQRALAVELLS